MGTEVEQYTARLVVANVWGVEGAIIVVPDAVCKLGVAYRNPVEAQFSSESANVLRFRIRSAIGDDVWWYWDMIGVDEAVNEWAPNPEIIFRNINNKLL